MWPFFLRVIQERQHAWLLCKGRAALVFDRVRGPTTTQKSIWHSKGSPRFKQPHRARPTLRAKTLPSRGPAAIVNLFWGCVRLYVRQAELSTEVTTTKGLVRYPQAIFAQAIPFAKLARAPEATVDRRQAASPRPLVLSPFSPGSADSFHGTCRRTGSDRD